MRDGQCRRPSSWTGNGKSDERADWRSRAQCRFADARAERQYPANPPDALSTARTSPTAQPTMLTGLRPGGRLVGPFGNELLRLTRRSVSVAESSEGEDEVKVLAQVCFAPLWRAPQ